MNADPRAHPAPPPPVPAPRPGPAGPGAWCAAATTGWSPASAPGSPTTSASTSRSSGWSRCSAPSSGPARSCSPTSWPGSLLPERVSDAARRLSGWADEHPHPGHPDLAARDRHPELLAARSPRCWRLAARRAVAVVEIDPALADTAAMSEAYDLRMDTGANCVVVGGRRDGEERIAACLVRADTRADVNNLVKRDPRRPQVLVPVDGPRGRGVRRWSTAGSPPSGCPPRWRLLVDPRVLDIEVAVIGSRRTPVEAAAPRAAAGELPGAEVIEGLAAMKPRGRPSPVRRLMAAVAAAARRARRAAAATTTAPTRRRRSEPDEVALHADRRSPCRRSRRRPASCIADIEQSSRDGAAQPVRGLDRQRHRQHDHADQGDLPRRPVPDRRCPAPGCATSRPRRGAASRSTQPDQPACDRTAARERHRHRRVHRRRRARRATTVPVTDDADVIARSRPARCLELDVDQVAHLSWADEVTASGDGGRVGRHHDAGRSTPPASRAHAGDRQHRGQPGALRR